MNHRSRLSALFYVAAPALFCAGCGNEVGFGQQTVGEPPVQSVLLTDRFVQQPLPLLDLLFVVDNTASMAQEQQALAETFALLADDLDERELAWQLGVTTTDMAQDAGRLQGQPYILTPQTPNRDEVLTEALLVGTAGTGPEAGLAAAVAALEASALGGQNAGFRRAGAALHVVFVSDSDDESDHWLSAPVEDFLAVLEGSEQGPAGRASALVGEAPSGCVSERGAAQPGFRYLEVAAATGGAQDSICADDLSAALSGLGDASLLLETRFFLSEAPIPGSIRVRVNDAEVDGWSAAPYAGETAIVFAEPPVANARIAVSYLVSVGEGR